MTAWDNSQGKFLEEFNSQERLYFDMTNSLQVGILILSKEVGHLFWVWIKLAKSDKLFSVFCEKSIIKLLLAYSFQKIFIIGQNSKGLL